MNEDFIKSSIIKNGYFYTFEYEPKDRAIGYDLCPFVYVIGPWFGKSNIPNNNFTALNLHHLSLSERVDFITRLYSIMNGEERTIVTLENLEINYKHAIRVYDRKRIKNLWQCKNKTAKYYIKSNGLCILAKRDESFEAIKQRFDELP